MDNIDDHVRGLLAARAPLRRAAMSGRTLISELRRRPVPQPRLTRNDVNQDPHRYWGPAVHPGYDPAAAAEARATRCEHGAPLMAACGHCVRVHAVLADQASPAMRRAYDEIVRWRSSRDTPRRIPPATCHRLARLHVVVLHDDPDRGPVATPVPAFSPVIPAHSLS